NQNMCWNSSGSPPSAGSKMPTCAMRSSPISDSVIASTGVASTITTLTAYMPHTNSGSLNQVMPGIRNLCVVTMKLSPVRIVEKPVTNTPTATRITLVLENIVENGV